MRHITQKERVLSWLKDYGSINCNEAYEQLGIKHNSLCNAIHDLRHEGHIIETKDRNGKNKWGEPVKITWYELHDGEQTSLSI